MTFMSNDTVVCEGITIPFRYCRSRRRTLGMTVRPDKSVAVRVPLRTPLGDIRDFVSRKGAWVMKVWQRLDSQPPKPRQSYDRDATFLFQGRECMLRIERASTEVVSLHGDALVVQTPQGQDGEQLRELINAWYRERAMVLFSERVMECHRRMQAELLPFPPIVIRGMKSRWGSYSYRTGRMSLNFNLIKAPLSCLDYVIIHELCHIKVANHGPKFWKLVGRYVPDYAEQRRQLRNCVTL
jgi:predicted metal-dependent hydrolase